MNPKIQYVYFKDEEATHSMDIMDHFLSDVQKGRQALKSSIEEIKSYSSRKAKKILAELYAFEDLIESLLDVVSQINPENQKEKKLLHEFALFGNEFIGIIGLLEVMSLDSKRRNQVLNNNGKPSKGSIEVNLDLL
ncbi:hypothetical protein [Leptospira bandrabouensis]|uniref:Uncharacterized protein n=1 Tax=Leptospira bandrabouensis TaxID=2484903 RepID=A0A6H3NT78_9LEPT|nr:hypothetical protein [Leptospira bandrabouensis]TGN07435.1 hypothetical protein EHR07_04755 [Leptospira bandrabouensis]TGN12820.1 hypothetical protein EHR08_15850 [Leptospira bandrabouensis]